MRQYAVLAGLLLAAGLLAFGLPAHFDYMRRAEERGLPAGPLPPRDPTTKPPRVARPGTTGHLEARWAGERRWVERKLQGMRLSRGKVARMPGLPYGFVDTQVRLSTSCSGQIEVLAAYHANDWQLKDLLKGQLPLQQYLSERVHIGNQLTISDPDWTVEGISTVCVPGEPGARYYVAYLLLGPREHQYILASEQGENGSGMADHWSAPYTVTVNEGPFALGVRYTLEGTANPKFGVRDGVLEYRWFPLPETKRISSCAGYTLEEDRYDPEDEGTHVVGVLKWWGQAETLDRVCGKFTNLTVQGVTVDTTGLLDGSLKGLGGGAAELDYRHSNYRIGGAHAFPPVRVRYDLRLTKFGCADWALRIVDSVICVKSYDPDGTLQQPWREYLETPMNEEFIGVLQSWPNGRISGWKLAAGSEFYIPADVRAAQDPPLPDNDSGIPVRGRCANMADSYQPFTIGVLESLPVHRPDGNLLSSYVSSDETRLEVAEGPSTTTFTVKALGATVARTLQTTWRTRHLDKTSPEWDPAAHRYTKHVAGDEDIWSWSTFAFLKLLFRCPVACQVQMRLDWTHVAISDPYVTGSERQENWEAQQHAGSSVYTFNLQAQPNADQEARIDLLFPDAGGPAYIGRIDKITLSGLTPMPNGQPATVVLKDAMLDSGRFGNQVGPAYVKLALGPPVQRGDYSVPVISRDGAFVFGNVTDREYKANEVGEYGGGTRHTEPMTGSVTGIIMDTQKTIAAFVGELAGVEGMVAVYNEAAYLAANSDGTNTLSPENTDWIHPITPYQTVTSGEAYAPPCSPCCRKIMPVNAIPFTVWVNHPLQAGIEVLAHIGGKRAHEALQFQAVYQNGGEKKIVPGASGVTDLYGYAVVAPIPANADRAYDVEQVS